MYRYSRRTSSFPHRLVNDDAEASVFLYRAKRKEPMRSALATFAIT